MRKRSKLLQLRTKLCAILQRRAAVRGRTISKTGERRPIAVAPEHCSRRNPRHARPRHAPRLSTKESTVPRPKEINPSRSAITGTTNGNFPGISYNRCRDLPRLVPMLAEDLHTPTIDRQQRLLGLIRRALRKERCRGLNGDWTYDLARHAALLAAYRAECSNCRFAPQPVSTAGQQGPSRLGMARLGID